MKRDCLFPWETKNNHDEAFLASVHALPHFILAIALCNRHGPCSHLTDGETEAQRDEITFPRTSRAANGKDCIQIQAIWPQSPRSLPRHAHASDGHKTEMHWLPGTRQTSSKHSHISFSQWHQVGIIYFQTSELKLRHLGEICLFFFLNYCGNNTSREIYPLNKFLTARYSVVSSGHTVYRPLELVYLASPKL